MNVKKTKKFKENRPENYHVHDSRLQREPISLFQTQTKRNPYLFHGLNYIRGTGVILEGERGRQKGGRHCTVGTRAHSHQCMSVPLCINSFFSD